MQSDGTRLPVHRSQFVHQVAVAATGQSRIWRVPRFFELNPHGLSRVGFSRAPSSLNPLSRPLTNASRNLSGLLFGGLDVELSFFFGQLRHQAERRLVDSLFASQLFNILPDPHQVLGYRVTGNPRARRGREWQTAPRPSRPPDRSCARIR